MISSNQSMQKKNGKRLLVLDAVRGLAVIGMFVQHFALNRTNSFVSGNTMILFMLCSGISYTLMGRKMLEKKEMEKQFYTRVLSRSVFIDFIGYAIIMLNGPFAMVLCAYAMLFLISLFLIKRSTRTLIWTAALLFIIAPPLMIIGLSLFANTAVLSDIAGGPLSALAWMPVFVTGMIIGRLHLEEMKTAKNMILLGTVILVPFKIFSVLILPNIRMAVENQMIATFYAEPNPYAAWPGNIEPIPWHLIFIDAPQSGSMFELLIGTGGSLILLGIFILAEKKLAMLYKPFACVGRSALTLYVMQFLIAWGLAMAGIEVTSIDIGSIFMGDIIIAAAVIAAGCLLARLSNAPLEGAIRRFEHLFV